MKSKGKQQNGNNFRTKSGRVSMKTIKEIANRIAEQFDVEKIILFGSYAYGNPTKGSDVDLFVVMNHTKRNNRKQMFEISGALPPRLFPMDLVVRTPHDLETRIPLGDWFLKDIVEKGKILFERPRS